MIKLGLLGKNISHSLSPKLYSDIYGEKNVEYSLLDFNEKNQIPPIDKLMIGLDGLNITSPYKEHFIKDVIIKDDFIRSLAAINCIAKVGEQFFATNTDYSAMLSLLPDMAKQKHVVILGDGVMSRITQTACLKIGLQFEVYSRRLTPEKFNQMELVDENVLVINCCSREYAFNGKITAGLHFWDLNYLHQAHLQLFKYKKNYIDGLNLLREQARDAAAFWSSLKN